jgi:hypothetical protein
MSQVASMPTVIVVGERSRAGVSLLVVAHCDSAAGRRGTALVVSMKEDGLSTGAGAARSGSAGGLVASGAHVSIAPLGRGDSV